MINAFLRCLEYNLDALRSDAKRASLSKVRYAEALNQAFESDSDVLIARTVGVEPSSGDFDTDSTTWAAI